MKTFGKVMLTFLYIFMAGIEIYACKSYLREAENIWQ